MKPPNVYDETIPSSHKISNKRNCPKHRLPTSFQARLFSVDIHDMHDAGQTRICVCDPSSSHTAIRKRRDCSDLVHTGCLEERNFFPAQAN
jgi:hypothetical protein